MTNTDVPAGQAQSTKQPRRVETLYRAIGDHLVATDPIAPSRYYGAWGLKCLYREAPFRSANRLPVVWIHSTRKSEKGCLKNKTAVFGMLGNSIKNFIFFKPRLRFEYRKRWGFQEKVQIGQPFLRARRANLLSGLTTTGWETSDSKKRSSKAFP